MYAHHASPVKSFLEELLVDRKIKNGLSEISNTHTGRRGGGEKETDAITEQLPHASTHTNRRRGEIGGLKQIVSERQREVERERGKIK